MPPRAVITRCGAPADFAIARELFLEHAEALGVDLCFQGFDEELRELEAIYSPPGGTLLLARENGERPLGCVGVRRLAESVCEMKRLYVLPAARGAGLGARLAEEIVLVARRLGYARMRLDTLPSMDHARRLYRAMGFVEIPPYYENPHEGVLFLELAL